MCIISSAVDARTTRHSERVSHSFCLLLFLNTGARCRAGCGCQAPAPLQPPQQRTFSHRHPRSRTVPVPGIVLGLHDGATTAVTTAVARLATCPAAVAVTRPRVGGSSICPTTRRICADRPSGVTGVPSRAHLAVATLPRVTHVPCSRPCQVWGMVLPWRSSASTACRRLRTRHPMVHRWYWTA